jgi:short-subunit dehydrogenase
VARIGYAWMFAGRLLVVPGIPNKAFVFAGRFLPRRLYLSLISKINALRRLKAR